MLLTGRGELLRLFLGRLHHAHLHELLAEVVADVRQALAFHVHQRRRLQHLLGLLVGSYRHHLRQRPHRGSTLAARGRPDIHCNVELGLGQVVLVFDLAIFADHRAHQLDAADLLLFAEHLHLPARLDVDVLRHRQPDFTAAPDALGIVGHVQERLHVQFLLYQVDGLAGDVRDDLLALLRVAQHVADVLLGQLQQRGHCLRDCGRFGVADRRACLHAAVRRADRVDKQVRVIAQVVFLPHHLMPGNLFRDKDRLFDAAVCGDFGELRPLHVRQPLGVLRQPDMSAEPLDVVYVPPLAVYRHNRDMPTGQVTAVLQNHLARHDVLAHLAALDALLAHLEAADGLELGQQLVVQVFRPILFLRAVQASEDADHLGSILDAVVLGDVDDIRRAPVKFILMDRLRPARRVIVVSRLVGVMRHAGQDEAARGVGFVLALCLQVEEHAAVGIEDRLNADALPLVFVVFFRLVYRPQAPRPESASDRFLKGVVVGFLGHAVLLVGPEKPVADICEAVVLAVFRSVVDRDAVRPVLGADPLD